MAQQKLTPTDRLPQHTGCPGPSPPSRWVRVKPGREESCSLSSPRGRLALVNPRPDVAGDFQRTAVAPFWRCRSTGRCPAPLPQPARNVDKAQLPLAERPPELGRFPTLGSGRPSPLSCFPLRRRETDHLPSSASQRRPPRICREPCVSARHHPTKRHPEPNAAQGARTNWAGRSLCRGPNPTGD